MDVAALEQRLRDHPGDLDSWSAYGDRLTERGDERGTLIRLERRRARAGAAERAALERECAALVEEHRQGWDTTLPPETTVLERRYGFPTKVAVEWSDDAPVRIEQALRAPFVTALRIAPPPQNAEELEWDWEDEVEIESTDPSPDIDTGALATLDLGRLTELDLSYLRIGALGAGALAVSTYLRLEASDVRSAAPGRIETLDLRYTRVGDDGLAALAESPSFGGVRRLRLQRNALTAKGVSALHRFGRLTELDLRYNKIGAEGVRALLEAPFVGSLTRLHLYRADVEDDGAALLARAPQLPPAMRSYWRSV
ncbi:hypothetical protein GCM10009678_49020 [Actinomadura kijaniata]|uniref:Uncharacterized protein (TIGR02996 family) n=1 Tax=Actinomadura namibiensis TaxID=182080 RepID=A0A7W3LWC4_ACTNM|nr:hypothetical protein [Actinomadura namibiensis]MBA8955449.1 uncharacterized protein (TIGR02996 family) [Actinomadura namibiensis]